MKHTALIAALAGSLLALSIAPAPAMAQERPEGAPARDARPDFPSWREVSEGFTQARTDADGGLYGLWVRERDGQVLAELPRGWANQRHLISMTMPRGQIFAGLQMGERYVYWKRFDKRIALMEPNLDVRSTGDPESRQAIQHHFTDRVLIDVPIRCMGPNGQPVVDLTNLLVGNASTFYGRMADRANTRLVTVKSAKAFPQNIEVAFEMPVGNGAMHTFHYSISLIPDRSAYKPRMADERVGYFTVSYQDFGKFKHDEVWVRYIKRWHLEKRDPKLRMSPPKEPIIFYVEHTTPPRYRRWVKEGVQYWNKAFEKVGLVDAIEVYYQDKETGAHMEKDPEDVRYNFIRWLSNDVGTAIGPSRAHPLTGQILDADIVLTDGWIRHFWHQANEFLPQIAMEGMNAETLAWLEQNPDWDPRVRLAPPEDRDRVMRERIQRGIQRFGGQPIPTDPVLAHSPELMDLWDMLGHSAKLCMASNAKAMDMALMGLSLEVLGMLDEALDPPSDQPDAAGAEAKKDEEKEEKPAEARPRRPRPTEETDLIDGIPEWFVGPMLADLVAHEVGHTLGLRHNFRASSVYTLAQVNSEEWKGKRPIATSVMDYTPVNVNMDPNAIQGDYHVNMVGPYDIWAIEYGYTFDDPKKVLKRVSDPELTYATDEDTSGPDPLARRYDFSAEPREYAESRMQLVKFLRERIIDKFVKDGDSWSKARRGYHITLSTQTDALNIMANWLGGSFVNRDRKGDSDRPPITPVPATQQRAALRFIIDNAFYDHAFGLSSDLLQRMTVDKWLDGGSGSPTAEPTWAVHDRIMGIQASALTWLLNPTTLRRIYDNEFVKSTEDDALTLPELLDTVKTAVWSELDENSARTYTPREPMISSLRRNLQREHMDRLVDLSMGAGSGASRRPVATLATMQLRDLHEKIEKLLERKQNRADAYTRAHLAEAKLRIEKALDAQFIYNASSGGRGGGFGGFVIGIDSAAPAQPTPQRVEPSYDDGR